MKLGEIAVSGAFAAVVATMPFAIPTYAATYYVDPTGEPTSSDLYDGTAETWEGGDSTVGPMKTLAKALEDRVEGDVVIALPGVYDKGVSNPEAKDSGTELMRRVIIPDYVTLKSKCGPKVTFIVGEASTAPNATATGCGTNAVGCVYNKPFGRLQGFTVTGGRTLVGSTGGSNYGGAGVYAGRVVDCIISNNACSYRGAGTHACTMYGCWVGSNTSADSNRGDSMNFGTAYGCYFYNGEVRSAELYGCTMRAGFPNSSTVYNSIILSGGSSANNGPKFYRSLYTVAHPNDKYEELNDGCVKISSSQIAMDENGVVTNAAGLALVRDKGNNDYCSAVWKTGPDFRDIVGNCRILNGVTDIGAFEYNPTGEVSRALSPEGAVAVTNLTASVVYLDNSVSIGPGGELMGVLNTSEHEKPTLWSFVAEVKGTGTLKAFFEGASEPYRSLTSADGQVEVQWSGEVPAGVRLVYDGEEGSAEVRKFTRDTLLAIIAEEGGLAISGDCTEPGVYVVAQGETKTVAISRSATATRFLSGVKVDGVFHDFNSYVDGICFAVTGSVRTSSLRIEAVYATTHEWFVDARNGNDGYCGLYTNFAFKTLAAAAAVATSPGDKILAAPGVYNEGGMNHSTYGSNRVSVATGVLLEGYGGAGVTTIEGKLSTANSNGCGPDSMRAVYLQSSSSSTAILRGFTITKGRSSIAGNDKGNGGGVLGGTVVDCVFSNNVAGYRGNSAASAKLFRCYIGDDPVGSWSLYSGVTLVDCVHDTDKIGYSSVHAYNTTFLRGFAKGNSDSNPVSAYNCIFRSSSPSNCKLYNCICRNSLRASEGAVNADGASQFNVDVADIAYDEATQRPLASSIAVDAGNNSYYALATNKWPSAARSLMGLDYAGGQRVYNGSVDIGCGEYDWRGRFSKALADKGVSVAAASWGVTTNAVLGLDVPEGDAICMKLLLKTSGTVVFRVAADDLEAVQVLVGGVPVAVGEGGVVSFEAAAGESDVEVSCSAGTASVSSVVLPRLGVLLIMR